MDCSWINSSCLSDEYEKGVADFLEFAKRNVADSSERYFCPCVKCMNGRRHKVEVIREHLLCDGFFFGLYNMDMAWQEVRKVNRVPKKSR